MEKIEIINGVTVIHTGDYIPLEYKGQVVKKELIKCFYNGNQLYANFTNIDEIKESAMSLAKVGVNPFVGPTAPTILEGGITHIPEGSALYVDKNLNVKQLLMQIHAKKENSKK